MIAALPSLAEADWLQAPPVQAIFAALDRDGEDVRVIGGAVRDAILGRTVSDVDFGTTALPDVVSAWARAAGFKVIPTGIDHGTVTLALHGKGYQVTTLREDIETDGRRAVVRFGRDWEADARRRDFTMNALSVDRRGTVHDPLGGYPDLIAGRIRFIGEPDRRIAEDRLRILRFFRFYAQYGAGGIDREGLSAAIRAREGLRDLSAERIGQEMRRLVVAPRAAETLAIMQDSGILGIVLAGIGYTAAFERLARFEDALGVGAEVPRRLAALACRIAEDVDRVSERLRLANVERERMRKAVAAAAAFASPLDDRAARGALYRLGAAEPFQDGVVLAFAFASVEPDDARWQRLFRLPERWEAPRFPIRGRDIVAEGTEHGPTIGALLKSVEDWWVAEDFAPDEAALRRRLQQMLAAVQ